MVEQDHACGGEAPGDEGMAAVTDQQIAPDIDPTAYQESAEEQQPIQEYENQEGWEERQELPPAEGPLEQQSLEQYLEGIMPDEAEGQYALQDGQVAEDPEAAAQHEGADNPADNAEAQGDYAGTGDGERIEDNEGPADRIDEEDDTAGPADQQLGEAIAQQPESNEQLDVAGEQLAAVPEDDVLQQPPPAPYVPPEVGEDYIPVAQLPPLPEPHAVNEEGRPMPLEGVESIFLTGTTVEIVGLGGLGGEHEGRQLMAFVSKEDLLKDIQFRGAISDFHAFKSKIMEADYDPLCFRIIEDDLFGDGNNYQLAIRKEASEMWQYIQAETSRRKQLELDEQLRAAIERAKPRSQKKYKVKPWVSLGSEVDIEEGSIKARRDPIRVVVSRTRREFNQPYRHADKDAHELWNSSQMECRPFKDPNFDLRKIEQEVGCQAVPTTVDVEVQHGGEARLPRPQAVQYQALTLPPSLTQEAVAQLARSRFLERAAAQCEVALIQNEITNIFEDDFNALSDEEGLTSNKKESIITETQSFTHLTYSKNKVVSAVQWLPHRRGVVAVACTEALSHSERVARAGRPCNAYILIWNFKDSIHPECVLQSPYEVFTFQYNPANPDLVAAGCYNGQVVVWDTSTEPVGRRAGPRTQDAAPQNGAAASQGSIPSQQSNGASGNADEPSIPVIKCKYASTVDMSHHNMVTDLRWLPGVEVNSRGRVSRAAGGPRDCNFLATTAGDGKINFWDIRLDRLMKKGRRVEDSSELIWKPCFSLHVISLIGMDLSGSKLSFHASNPEQAASLVVGSGDGELVVADLVRPGGGLGEGHDAQDNPDAVRSITQAHVGPIVSLERSPFFDDIILTVGDWSFQIWREGQTTPLFASGYAPELYTCGCWSPSRPALLYVADQGGSLQVWDLLDRSHAPSIRVTLASCALTSLAFMDVPLPGTSSNMAVVNNGNSGGTVVGATDKAVGGGAAQHQDDKHPDGGAAHGGGAAALASSQQAAGQYLALGDAVGTLRIVELPRNLRRPVTHERKLMGVWLDKEGERVADVAARKPLRDAANKQWEEAQKRAQEEAEMAIRDQQAQKDQQLTSTQPAHRASVTLMAANGTAAAATKAAAAAAAMALLVDEKAEADYLALEQRFKEQLGLIEATS